MAQRPALVGGLPPFGAGVYAEIAEGQAAIEVKFHITGAFEFLEDDFIHSGTGIDQCCGEDRQASTFFNVPGRTSLEDRHVVVF